MSLEALASNPPATETPLTLDAAGGVTISGTAAVVLALANPALRCLDVVHAPRLRELDLSACAPGLHLALSGCPRIERIRLPEHGQGAVLHLDSGAVLPDLEIRGLVDHLDACWEGSELATARRRGLQPFQGARLGAPETIAPDHELVVLVGTGDPEASMAANSGGLRHLVVQAMPGLEHLSVPEPVCLERLEIIECPRLKRIGGAAAGRVGVSRCAALRHVSLSGTALRLYRCASDGETLDVTGRWSRMSVIETDAARLNAPSIDHLLVRDAPSVAEAELSPATSVTLRGDCRMRTEHLETVVQLDDRAVAELIERAVTQDAAAERMLREWCVQPVSARQTFDTLRALSRSAGRYGAPEHLWILRCLLHASGRRKAAPVRDPLALAQRDWHWRFPADLAQEGWDADLRLWASCRGWYPAARCGRVLVRGRALMPVVALAHLVCERSDEPDLRRCLVDALRHRARASRRARPGDREDEHHCWRLLQSAIALHDSEVADALVAVADCLLTAPVRLRLYAALIAAGHPAARTAAMRLANDARQDQELRSSAMATALAQARRDALAPRARSSEATDFAIPRRPDGAAADQSAGSGLARQAP